MVKYKAEEDADVANEEVLNEESLARLFDKKQTKESFWRSVDYV